MLAHSARSGLARPVSLLLRPFRPDDQQAVRELVLNGLGEHFGVIDATLNPDLDDIQSTYVDSGGLFIVAEIDRCIVGTGALIEEEPGVGRLVRMSVAAAFRGQGIGRALVRHLLDAARERGYARVVCETNHDWSDAIGLYRSCGFREVALIDGDRHFAIDIG